MNILTNWWPVLSWLVYVAWCLALAALAYGQALRLPFFFDDFVHLPFVDAHSLSEIWQTAGTLAYYRPLPFTVWKIMALILSRHSPLGQHAFNLLLHLVNGLLAGWLAGQLWRREDGGGRWTAPDFIRALLASGLFLLFPFSYQAVPWVGSLAHLLVTSLILASLSTYWLKRISGRRAWGVVSLIAAFLAPFAHENGILTGPLLAVILFTGSGNRQTARQKMGQALLWTVPALLWLPVWWLAPKGAGDGLTFRNIETILQNSAYVLQGVTFPLSWLGGWLRDRAGFNDMAAVATLVLPALIGAGLIQWRTGAGRRSLLSYGWIGLASMPVLLFLTFDYVINGPRLLMLASVGAAWLWADVAVRAAGWSKQKSKPAGRPWLRQGLVLGLCFLVLAQSFLFIRRRMGLHEMLGDSYKQLVALTTEANEENRTAVFVNLPAWVAPGQSTYALGHEGVQFLPNYAHPETVVSVHTGRPVAIAFVRREAIWPQVAYHYGVSESTADWGQLAGGRGIVYAAAYEDDKVTFMPAGLFSPQGSGVEALAHFESDGQDGRVTLLSAVATANDDHLVVDLTWRVDETMPEQITAFVHVLDGNGQMIVQADGDPLDGGYPFNEWEPGLAVLDRRVTGEAEAGRQVLVGLYDRLSGQRWTAASPQGQLWADNAVTITVP